MYNSKIDTMKHIETVGEIIRLFIYDLDLRICCHDTSKLIEPEKAIFDEYTPKLKNSTYGSDEYKTFLLEMGIALDHHYKTNRHHPEHFENGIMGMTVIDLCEMLADWKAATLRHDNGDIFKSIDINQIRFGYSDELKQIFINTANQYFINFGVK
jgi:hypothetical protein